MKLLKVSEIRDFRPLCAILLQIIQGQIILELHSIQPDVMGVSGGERQLPQIVGQTWTVGQYSFDSGVNVCRTL